MNSEVYIYRMTHISNIEHMVKNGVTTNESPKRNPHYMNIGNEEIQKKREAPSKINIPNTPFYFRTKTPMLHNIQNGHGVRKQLPEDIVYIVSSISKLESNKIEFKYSNGHVLNTNTKVYEYTNIDKLKTDIDHDNICKYEWPYKLINFNKVQSECIVFRDIPLHALEGYIVYNEEVKIKLKNYNLPNIKRNSSSYY